MEIEGLACAELEEDGAVDLLDSLHAWPGGTASQHFRAPDGNVYEVVGRLKEAVAGENLP